MGLEDKKKCSTCTEFLDFSKFNKDKNKKDGLCYECRICRKKRNGTYKAEHTRVKCCSGCSKVLELNLDNFYKKLKGFSNKCRKCSIPDIRKNYKKHKDKYLEQKKEYWQENKDRITEYREENKEMLCASRRKWVEHKRKNDPMFRIRKNIGELIRRAIEKRGYKKGSKTEKILGIDFESYFKHLCETFEENYGIPREYIPWNDIHIDHVIPMATASTEEEAYKLNHYKNLQLLFACDNIEKRDKLDWSLDE